MNKSFYTVVKKIFLVMRKVVKKSFLFMGLDIRRSPRASRRFVWLKKYNIKTVFDIGAHTGEFAKMIHTELPEALIYSFEPLKDCYERLVNNMKHMAKAKAFNYALGDEDSETEIHRSEYSASSSLLPMGNLHKQAFPYTKGETLEKIRVKRLDSIAQNLDCIENILIKIDVQGFEDKVILGGQKILSKAKILIIETSFEMLYEGQPLFDAIYDMLKQMGFFYKGNLDQLLSPLDGRILQADSIFVRSK